MKRLLPSVIAVAALALAPTIYGAEGCSTTTAAGCPAQGECPMAAQAHGCPADCDKPCCASEAQLTKVTYQVDALACADCENKVNQALASVKGVGSAKACSKEKMVQVAYNAKLATDKDLLAAIKKAGFKVDSETVELKVEGMKCGACAEKVSDALAKVKGVREQKVCHESGNAIVKFDPATVSRDKVLAAIGDTGFEAIQ